MQQTFEVRGDTVIMRVRGPFDDEMMQELLRLLETEVLNRHPYYFVLMDGRQMNGFPAAARHRVSKWPHLHRNGGNALVGTGLLARTALTMVARAVMLFRQISLPMAFFATEEEAAGWIVRRRQELGLNAAAPPSS